MKMRTQITFVRCDRVGPMPGRKKGSLFKKYIPTHELIHERPEWNSLAVGKSSLKYGDSCID